MNSPQHNRKQSASSQRLFFLLTGDLHSVRVGLVDQAGPADHLRLVSHLHLGAQQGLVNPAAANTNIVSHVTLRHKLSYTRH